MLLLSIVERNLSRQIIYHLKFKKVTIQPSARFRCASSRCGRTPYEFSAVYAYESKLSPAYAVKNTHG
jgi:hypothetical protein